MPFKGCLTSDFKFQDDAEVWRYEPRGQPNTVKVKHKNLEKIDDSQFCGTTMYV